MNTDGFDDDLFPNLTGSILGHLIDVEPARDWRCRASLDDDCTEVHLYIWCPVDGGTFGYILAFPPTAGALDHDALWVERIATRVTVVLRRLLFRLN